MGNNWPCVTAGLEAPTFTVFILLLFLLFPFLPFLVLIQISEHWAHVVRIRLIVAIEVQIAIRIEVQVQPVERRVSLSPVVILLTALLAAALPVGDPYVNIRLHSLPSRSQDRLSQ